MSGKSLMGAEEEGTNPTKLSNPKFLVQENRPTFYLDWWSPMQACYCHGSMPPLYFPSIKAPPTHHPYMWESEIESPLQPIVESTSTNGEENVDQPISSKDDAKATECVLVSTDEEECDLMLDDKEECDLVLDGEEGDEILLDEKERDDTSKLDLQNEQEVDDISIIGKKFSSAHELTEFYRLYDEGVGFGICIQISKTSTKDGVLKYLTIGCSRYGKTRFKGTKLQTKLKLSSKTDCVAKINASLKKGFWIMNTIELSHNHGLSPNKARFHRCNRKLDSISKRELEINDRFGIFPSKNFLFIVHEARGDEKVPFTERDCWNHINTERCIQLAKEVVKHFVFISKECVK